MSASKVHLTEPLANAGSVLDVKLRSKAYVPDVPCFIGLCEINYTKLMQLLPMFEEIDQRRFGLAHNDSSMAFIRISIQERCKYTTMLLLEQASSFEALPKSIMHVRLYHDASMAEVTSYQGIKNIRERYSYSDTALCQKDEKALCNEFLSDWLSYCLKFGLSTESAHQASQDN